VGVNRCHGKPVKLEPTIGARKHHEMQAVLAAQHGILSYQQALSIGVTHGTIRSQVAAGRWTVASRGVYFARNGRPGWKSRLWAALLACGEGAVISHWTAAVVWGLATWVRGSGLVEVSIPADRQEIPVPGVRVRRSRLLPRKATRFEGLPIHDGGRHGA